MTGAVAATSGQRDRDATAELGFWIYILTDCVLFAALFATFAVLRRNTSLGPPIVQIFAPRYVLVETLVLLFSSFTCALGVQAVRGQAARRALAWLGLTFLLGALFVALEAYDLVNVVRAGESWRRSGALSAYFALVGTHGFHVVAGLAWLGIVCGRVLAHGITPGDMRRLVLFGVFWHFLDIIWIFIFTIVYMGTVALP